jgi:type II secretory pathway pseudopilin PulG
MNARMRATTWSKRTSGFTLIELIFAVLVVVLLAAVVLPNLVKAKDTRNRLQCASNLKEISLAYIIWINDHEAVRLPWWLPTAEGGNNDYGQGTIRSSLRNQSWFQFSWISNSLASPRALADPADKRPQLRVATSWGAAPKSGLANPSYQNNACSYALAIDAGPGPRFGSWPIDFPLNEAFLLDRHVSNDGIDAGCLSRLGLLTRMTRPFTTVWTKQVHGVSGGNVALLDCSVQFVATNRLRSLLTWELEWEVGKGKAHFIFPF